MEYYLKIDRINKQVRTDLPFNSSNGIKYCHEGYIYDDVQRIIANGTYPYANINGAYNLFANKDSEYFKIVNDKFGRLNIYYFISDNEIFFSNNFWNLVKGLTITENMIDYSELRRFIFFYGSNINLNTFIKGINIFPPATVFNYNFTNNTISWHRYWSYSRDVKIINLNEAVDQAYTALDSNFRSISQYFKDKQFIFGNSGGSDSRMIPYFAKKYDLKISGFTILNKTTRFKIKTATYTSSNEVRKHYGFKQLYIPWMPSDFDGRMLLDIRNAPVTSCNIVQNPYEHLSPFKEHILINGKLEYLLGFSHWSILRSYKDSISWNYFLYNILRDRALSQTKLQFLSECIDLDQYFDTSEVYRPLFNQYKSSGYINLFGALHYNVLDVTSHCGGFESINRTMFTLTLYYPYMDTYSIHWDDELMKNKMIVKELNKRLNPNYKNVPEHDFESMINETYLRSKVLKWQKRFGLFSSGMDFEGLLWNPSYLEFAKNIMLRNNPYFEPLGNPTLMMQKIIKSSCFHPLFSLNFLKIKKILDIIYYKEYQLLDRDDFKIA